MKFTDGFWQVRPGVEAFYAQEAYDLATYINTRPRPDFPGKELDWPKGDPPPDVAYPVNSKKK